MVAATVRTTVLCAVLGSAFAAVTVPAGLVEKTYHVGGYVCPGPQTAWTVRPDDNKSYPLVSFAHGWGDGVTDWYGNLLTNISSRGYVVVALESAHGLFLPTTKEYKDQLRTLEWARNSTELLPHINMSAGSALVGQSMGGGSTVMAASQADGVQAHDIRAAVAMHPMNIRGVAPKVPILFLAGSKDLQIPPSVVFSQYEKTVHGVERAFAEIKGADHDDSSDHGSMLEYPYVYDWLDCQMKHDLSACHRVTTCTVPGIEVTGLRCHHHRGQV